MEGINDKKTVREALVSLKVKIIDWYIIKKFLGTFFFCLILIMTIAVVFDFAEKIDNFMQHAAPWKAVVFEYYLNFIPYFATLFAPLLSLFQLFSLRREWQQILRSLQYLTAA